MPQNLQFTLDYLEDLRFNNNKTWFDENRKRYDQARATYQRILATYTGPAYRTYTAQAEAGLRDVNIVDPPKK